MIPAEALLRLLEEKDLVPPEVLAELRGLVAKSLKTPKPLNAAMVARILVERGYLSRLLAQRLMTQLESDWAARNPRQKIEPLILKPLEGNQGELPETFSLADEPVELLPLEEDRLRPPAIPAGEKSGPQIRSEPPLAADKAPPPPPPEPKPAEDLLSELLPPVPPGAAPGPAVPKWQWGRRRNPWESPLLLFGGGGILLLLFAGVVLLWSLNRRGGDELLAEADADYRAGSYTQAIHKFTDFIENFPQHPQAGPARVRRGLAQVRQALEVKAPLQALETIRTTLEEISGLPDFHAEADAELAAVLPQLAELLARSALQKGDASLVKGGQEAMSLGRRFIPQEKRPLARLAEIETTLQLAQRRISEKDELSRVSSSVEQLLQAGKLDEIYPLVRTFLTEFPQQRQSAELIQVLKRVAEAEKSRVRFEKPPEQPSSSVEFPVKQFAPYTLLKSEPAPVGEHHAVFVTDHSSVYVVDGVSGRLLWQCRTGEMNCVPGKLQDWPVVKFQEKDLLLVPDRARCAIVAREIATGIPRQVFQLPEPPTGWPVVEQGKALVLSDSGRLYVVNLNRGAVEGELATPQGAAFLPASQAAAWYLLAEQWYLFEIDPQRELCSRAWYLGHEAGQLAVPPRVVADCLVIPLRVSGGKVALHVLSLEEKGGENSTDVARQVVSLDGDVRTPLQVFGNRLAVITHQGNLQVFQVRKGAAGEPLGLLAEGKTAGTTLPGSRSGTPWVVFQGDTVWTADTALTRFELQASASRLVPRWVACENTLAIGPPIVIESVAYYAHRRPQQPGLFVSALNTETGRTYWEVNLADPAAGTPQVRSDEPAWWGVTSGGRIVQAAFAAEDRPCWPVETAGKVGTLRVPERSPEPLVCMPEPGVWVLTFPGADEVRILDARPQPANVRQIKVRQPVSGPLLGCGGGFGLGLQGGVFLWFPGLEVDASPVAYQAGMTPGEDLRFSGGLAVSRDTVILADNQGRIFRLKLVEQGEKAIQMQGERLLESPLTSSLVLIRGLILGVTENRELVALQESDLAVAASVTLPAACVWGPYSAGDGVCLLTADGILRWGPSPSELKEIPLDNAQPVGSPLWFEGRLILATRGGMLVSVEVAKGTIVGTFPLYQPLVTGPALVYGHVLVGAADGGWLAVPVTAIQDRPEKE